jgi:vacuolar-type H+-ATPase subunit I/STV1
MEDDKRVNYKLDAINKLINNLKLSISGNKEHDELEENNVIVNLDEISQKITELHEMVKAEFDEFENQHKSESDETQTLLNNRFDKIDAKLDSIKAAVDSMKTTIGNKLDTVNSTINKANTDIVAAINAMKASNDTKNDAIITALQGLVTQVNRNTSNINSLNGRVDALEQA